MYSNSTFLTPSISNLCLYVLNNRLPGIAHYLQAVFIVSKFFGRLNKLENLNLKITVNHILHLVDEEVLRFQVPVKYIATVTEGQAPQQLIHE